MAEYEYDQLVSNLSTPQNKVVAVKDIFQVQNIHNQLWKQCVHFNCPANVICKQHDWVSLCNLGLNANFFTRDRWLDIDVITNKWFINGSKLLQDMRISARQYLSWKLTVDEMQKLQLSLAALHIYYKWPTNFQYHSKIHQME